MLLKPIYFDLKQVKSLTRSLCVKEGRIRNNMYSFSCTYVYGRVPLRGHGRIYTRVGRRPTRVYVGCAPFRGRSPTQVCSPKGCTPVYVHVLAARRAASTCIHKQVGRRPTCLCTSNRLAAEGCQPVA